MSVKLEISDKMKESHQTLENIITSIKKDISTKNKDPDELNEKVKEGQNELALLKSALTSLPSSYQSKFNLDKIETSLNELHSSINNKSIYKEKEQNADDEVNHTLIVKSRDTDSIITTKSHKARRIVLSVKNSFIAVCLAFFIISVILLITNFLK